MEVDAPADQKSSAMVKLRRLYSAVASITDELKDHECLSGDPESAYVNTMVEIKALKHNFINLSSYALFLEEFLKPVDSWIQENEIASQMEEITSMAGEEEKKYKEAQEKESAIIEKLTHAADQVKEIASWEEVAEEIRKKKLKCEDLSSRFKTHTKYFGEDCRNRDDAQLKIHKQREILRQMKNDLFCQLPSHPTLTPAHQERLTELLSNGINFASSSDSSTLSSIQAGNEQSNPFRTFEVVTSNQNYTVLELFYTNADLKQSSVEVKISYNCNEDEKDRKISAISIKNCPVEFGDLVDQAIAFNDCKYIFAELQYRLSESG